MAEFEGTTTVAASEGALFNYVSQVSNLPKYFARMTSAEPGEGEEVHTSAKMPDGSEVQGDAWFRVDASNRRIEWGSEGPDDYSGRLQVRGAGESSEVEVHISTARVDDGQVQDGIDETLANIKRLVESAGVTPSA